MKPYWLLSLLIVLPVVVNGQHVSVEGVVRADEGRKLYDANIMIFPDSILARSNVEGTFSVRISPGAKTFLVSYAGFETLATTHRIRHDSSLHFVLTTKIRELDEVLIEENRFSNADIFHSTASGTQTLTPNDFTHLPALMGESDILQAVQLLPGSAGGVEGTADVFVRGGSADQNLVLLDGAPIYNPSHLLGFLSVFNPDVLEKVDVIHGGFPAAFGGRLSSVLDVSTLSHIAERTSVSANIGLIASAFKLEQPITKDRLGFWVAGRSSYVDKISQVVPMREFPYSFHELNGKIIFHPSTKDEVEVGHYSAGDFLDVLRDADGDGRGMKTTYHANNSVETFRWRHTTPHRWKSDLSMFHTRFAYRTRNAFKEEYAVSGHSDIEDFGAKLSVQKDSIWKGATLSSGFEWMRHQISPKVVNPKGSATDLVGPLSRDTKIVQEFAAYVQQEWDLSPKLKLSGGIRASMAVTDARKYLFPEPRVSLRYAVAKDQALKFSYSRMVQYLHRISNSAISTPIDVWLPVTDTIGPQTGRQFALGWQHFMAPSKIFLSVEGFHKAMDGLLAYREGTNFLFKSDFQSMLVRGSGKSYGLEFLVRKEAGKFTGWISYSLSWSWRRYDALNHGEWFRARYDRRHNGAIVAQHHLGSRWIASLVWEYISGARFTPVVGQYLAQAPGGDGMELVPEFASVNSVKLSDAHRLDLSFKYFSKPGNVFRWNVFAGIYNAYNRATPFGIVIREDQADKTKKYIQPALFGLLPFMGYGCTF